MQGDKGYFEMPAAPRRQAAQRPRPAVLPRHPTGADEDRFLAAINGPIQEVPVQQPYPPRTLPAAKGQTREIVNIDGELLIDLGDRVLVYSKSKPGHWHEVIDDTCSCDGYAKWDKVCRHLRAARQIHTGTERVGMLELAPEAPPVIWEEGSLEAHEEALAAQLPMCPSCGKRPVAKVLGTIAKTCARCALFPQALYPGDKGL